MADKDSKALKIHSAEKIKGRSEKYSAAADCQRTWEQDGGQGMKSSVKSEERQRNREIKDRYLSASQRRE